MPKSKSATVRSVIFDGSKHDLKSLLLQWNVLRGVSIEILANDYVGGSFTVKFTREGGEVSEAEAKSWVDQALVNAK